MRATLATAAAVAATAIVGTTLAAAPTGAAVTYYYYGYAAGSTVRAINSAITAQLSAESTVLSSTGGARDVNSLAAVKAQGVLNLGTVNTSARTTSITGGTKVTVVSRTADINVLNGLITATAMTTTTSTQRVNGVSTSTTHSDFAGLHIAGVDLPVNIPQNYGVKLGDIASVTINAGTTGTSGDVSVGIGVGLRVTLLQPQGSVDQGGEIDINPTYTIVAPDSSPATNHSTLGIAYASKISAAAGKTISVRSDPTVPTSVFANGTKGRTITNTLAGVNLAPVGTLGALRTTGVGTNTTTVASTTMTASVANVNLLGGLIKATAVKVTAHADLKGISGSMTLTGLTIGGTRIPLSVKPNTVINLGIGKVIVNQQIRHRYNITVRGVDIVLLKPSGGLPVGAEIQLASATAAAS